ncbi:hypothetical protein IB269_16290 [Delftia sp. DLF01]|uniref:DUF6338 family protein n=1 Tax=Delftia sp. DLF01 TaxID=2769279 RepID=UPI00177B2C9F|nr:DUF6338 family protein [Delftia sp. DLF01]MBD9582952.1 hypothetical protein [Delftia sp. DLF01]
MDIWNVDKLVLFIAFVIPGFLLLKTSAVLGLDSAADSSKQVIDAVAYSCINYAVLAWPILKVESSGLRISNKEMYVAFYAFVVLVAPILLAFGWKFLRTTQQLQKIVPHPVGKPWDFFFRQRQRYWVLVTFKDGKQVGGRYDSRSFASATPAGEQLYLEEAWALNDTGGFERPRQDSAGILILGNELRSIEFFNMLQEESNVKQAESTESRSEGVAAHSGQSASAS